MKENNQRVSLNYFFFLFMSTPFNFNLYSFSLEGKQVTTEY